MPIITLPDGNNLEFPKNITGLQVAEKISKSLAKQAMIISVDGQLKDLDFADDLALLAHTYTQMQAKTTKLEAVSSIRIGQGPSRLTVIRGSRS